MSKWTPGKWHQDDKFLFCVCDERDYTVCSTFCDDRLESAYQQNAARLIAAAPEMAEALRRLAEAYEALCEMTGQTFHEVGASNYSHARALLARIEGD